MFMIIGLGSMGKRRIRLLKSISNDYVVIGVDSRADRRKEAEDLFGIKVFGNLDEAFLQNPKNAIVCTSPLSHAEIISKCLDHNCNVFTEINLVTDKYTENIDLANKKKLILFLSSTQMYKKEVQYIKDSVLNSQSLLNYTYHVGQYLPDWHPWETLNDFFVSDKRTNGCRELFAIEFPWIIDTFGKIKNMHVIKNNISMLDLKFEDNYLVMLEHASGHKGMIALDVVSRKAVRNFELYGENIYLTWDGTPSGLIEYDFVNKVNKQINLYDNIERQDGYASFVVENAYREELETFCALIEGKGRTKYSFDDDFYTLDIISKIEE